MGEDMAMLVATLFDHSLNWSDDPIKVEVVTEDDHVGIWLGGTRIPDDYVSEVIRHSDFLWRCIEGTLDQRAKTLRDGWEQHLRPTETLESA